MSEADNAENAPEYLQRTIFTARGEGFTLHQVLGAAEHLGVADALWDPLQDSLACGTYAAEEGFEDDPEELQAAMDEFRYRRRLVSADETERWLCERELSEDQLFDALGRERWRRRFQGQLDSIRSAYAPPPAAVGEALWPELIVGGRLGPVARALARLVVAPELLPAGSDSATEAPADGAPAAQTPPPRGCPAWARCGPQWRARLVCLERVYQAVCASLLTRRRLEEALVPRRLDLTRFRLLQARCSSPDAAREALLCIRQDGENFEQASARAAAAREDRLIFLEDAPEPLTPYLVSAVPGECFLVEEGEPGDEEDGDEQQQCRPLLVHVADKIPARLEDPEVRGRLETALLDRGFAPVIDEQVRWLCPVE